MSTLSRLTSLVPFNIPENSAATPGLWNTVYSVIDQNFSSVSAAVNSIVTSPALAVSGLSGIINGGLAPYSLVGDGATDSTSMLTLLDANATSGWALLPPGTYKVTSTITLSANYLRTPGAKLKPSSGKTVNLTGIWLQPDDTLVDTSAGGNVYWIAKQPARPQWWGVAGDGLVDDAAAWRNCINGMPDQGVVDNHGVHSAVGSVVTMRNREGLYIGNRHWPIQPSNSSDYNASFTWSGSTSSAAMFDQDICRHVTIEGTAFWTKNKINTAIRMDGFDALVGHGTRCKISHCYVNNQGNNTEYVGISISSTAVNNQEYHEILDSGFGCGVISSGQVWLNASAGSSHFTTVPGYTLNASLDSGRRLRYWNGTSCSTTTIISVVSSSYGIIQDTFGSTVTSSQGVIGTNTGICIQIGASSNAKNVLIARSTFDVGNYAVQLANGSVILEDNSFSDFEVDLWTDATGDNIIDIRSRSEQARQHARLLQAQGYRIESASYGPNCVLPGGGFFDIKSGPVIKEEFNHPDDLTPKGSVLWNLRDYQGVGLFEIDRIPSGYTMGMLGYETAANYTQAIILLGLGGAAGYGTYVRGYEVRNGVEGTWITGGQSLGTIGSQLTPGFAFSSESSLGFYRSGNSTIAASYGTLNLATNAVRLSMRTLGASQSSLNMSVDEVLFAVLGASGATLGIRSGGTIWLFNSSLSTKG